MAPVPLYPKDPTPDTDNHHRWWWWEQRDVNLADSQPYLVAEAVLAHRDASTEEEIDMAVYLVWTVELHPPWDGGCRTCDVLNPCAEQRKASNLALEFLIRRSTDLMRRSKTTVARFDEKRGMA